jgi:uncharacterized repeat protein (TIGR04138 family)
MQSPTFTEAIEQIVQRDPRFAPASYVFVREGLDFTVRVLKKNRQGPPEKRHVSGQELLEGLRQFALEQFGPLAKTVLEHWGVHQCADFGEIVFNMVENGVLGKTEQDSRRDFAGGYSFEDAFVKPYLPPVRPVSRHVRPAETDRRRDATRQPDSKKLSSPGPN